MTEIELEQEKIKEEIRRLEKLEKDDLEFLLSHKQGRRVIYRYLAFCKVFHSAYSSNQNDMFYYEGRRSVGLKILEDMQKHCPDRFFQMLKEHFKENN